VLERAALVTTEKAGRVRNLQACHARAGRRGRLDRAAPPTLERTLRRAGQDCRALEIKGEGRCPKEKKVVPPHEPDRRGTQVRRELVVTRTFNAPAHIVFEAWSKPELFQALVGSEVGGHVAALVRHGCAHRGRVSLRLQSSGLRPTDGVLRHVQRSDAEQAPRLDERRKRSGRRDHGDVRRNAGKTLVTLHELYPQRRPSTKPSPVSAEGLPEQFAQLEELLAGRSDHTAATGVWKG